MAKFCDLNEKKWSKWIKTRPQCIQDLASKYPPDLLYKMDDTGQRVMICSYSEDGTVSVIISAEYNFVVFERTVFGISPDTLHECDLPLESELIGTMLTDEEQIKKYITSRRSHTKKTNIG